MNIKNFSEMIKSGSLNFSLLLITPKPSFLRWLNSFQKRKGLGAYKSLRHFEEDSVWIIPKYETFSEEGSYRQFIEGIKPKLLLSELYSV